MESAGAGGKLQAPHMPTYRILRNLTKDSFGPHGTCAVLRANQFSGASMVSAVGGRFLADDDLLTNDPIGRLVLKNTSALQHESHGDGSLAAAFVACSLVERTMDRGPLSPATVALTVATFQRCLEWCEEHLRLPPSTQHGSRVSSPVITLGMPLSVGHLPSMLALLRAVLSPKALAAPDPDAVDAVAVQLLHAFILACPEETAKGTGHSFSADLAAGIRIHKVIGAPQEHSRCVEGIIIDTPVPLGPSDEQQLTQSAGGRVLVFAASLDVKLEDEGVNMQRRRVVKVGSTSSGWVPRVEQERHLAEVILGACRRLRVRIVISQRVINRRLQEQLVKAGILPLERISVRHVAAVVRLTGAQPLGSWRCEPDPQTASGLRGCVENAGTRESEWGGSVGVCGAINTIHVRGQKFTLICPPAPDTLVHRGCVVEKEVAQKCTPRGVATLLLCAPTEPEMRELDAVVQTAKTVCFYTNKKRGARRTIQ